MKILKWNFDCMLYIIAQKIYKQGQLFIHSGTSVKTHRRLVALPENE